MLHNTELTMSLNVKVRERIYFWCVEFKYFMRTFININVDNLLYSKNLNVINKNFVKNEKKIIYSTKVSNFLSWTQRYISINLLPYGNKLKI